MCLPLDNLPKKLNNSYKKKRNNSSAIKKLYGNMRIIPTIEIKEGKCVSLTNGDFSTHKVYNENPIEVARELEGAGMQYLHLVDLDGAKANHIVNYKIIEQITSKTHLKIDFVGGLKSNEDLHIAFNSGAKQISGEHIAINDPETFEGWLSKYGGIKIMLEANCNNEKFAGNGLQEESDSDIIPFIRSYTNKGIKYVICTDLVIDEAIEGASFELYKRILQESKDIKLIASGNVVSSLDDINVLEDLGCEGAIIGNALYEGKIRLRDLETYS